MPLLESEKNFLNFSRAPELRRVSMTGSYQTGTDDYPSITGKDSSVALFALTNSTNG